MPRLTRAENSERIRERLVATATTLFLRDGFAATSLDTIANEAGYSKGAVYSNFRNKDDLCLAVLDRIHAEQAGRIVEAMSGARNVEERLTAFERWAEANIGDEAWTSLEVEFAFSAGRDPRVRAELAERSKVVSGLLSGLVGANATEFGIALPMPAQDVAIALLSLGIGLGVQRALDPSVPVSVLTGTIRIMLGARP